jgi:TPR repeat protein
VSPSAADAPAAFGQSEVAQASKLLQSSNPEDSAVAADLLWSAVSKGNTKAEMMLADIYLEGHGTVRKNCRQAEALLTAAQSANVPGAEAKIEELQTYGCR